MNTEFIAILKKLISEQGREILFNTNKCKSFIIDYTHNEYKKESRLLLQALEAGIPKAIDGADDITICKKLQIKILGEEYYIKEEISSDVFDILLNLLRIEEKKEKKCPKCGKEIPSEWKACPYCGIVFGQKEKTPETKSPIIEQKKEEEIPTTYEWICKKCGQTMEEHYFMCINCGATNPNIQYVEPIRFSV